MIFLLVHSLLDGGTKFQYAVQGDRCPAPKPKTPRPPSRLMWVVVKIMVPFGVLIVIRYLIFSVPKKGP